MTTINGEKNIKSEKKALEWQQWMNSNKTRTQWIIKEARNWKN